eukprot:4659227-Pyramimonas_sp.AAC.1
MSKRAPRRAQERPSVSQERSTRESSHTFLIADRGESSGRAIHRFWTGRWGRAKRGPPRAPGGRGPKKTNQIHGPFPPGPERTEEEKPPPSSSCR